jgi:hypothetical protein
MRELLNSVGAILPDNYHHAIQLLGDSAKARFISDERAKLFRASRDVNRCSR